MMRRASTLALIACAFIGLLAGIERAHAQPDADSTPAAAPPVDTGVAGAIDADIDAPSPLTVGDPFWYVVTLRIPEDAVPELPGNETDIPPFEIRDHVVEQGAVAAGFRLLTIRYQLVGFEVGETDITDFVITTTRTVDGEEREDTYLAPPVRVTISSVLPGPGAEMKPIFGPLMVRPWWHSWVVPVILALLLIGALALGVWLWMRRANRTTEAAEPELTPHERALASLNALRDGKLVAAGRFKDFYSELSDTLRRWLEYRARIDAMEATTALIRHDLRRSDLPSDWQHDLLVLLGHADLVKFAKWTPDDAVAYTDLDTAFDLLQRGRLPESEPGREAVA